MKDLINIALVIALGLTVSACEWVKSEPGSETIALRAADAVAACTPKGRVSVSTLARVAGLERHPDDIAEELLSLARNEAATAGADTVVPEAPPEDGHQTFRMLVCTVAVSGGTG